MSKQDKKADERLPVEVKIHPDGQRVEVDSIGVSSFYLSPSRCEMCAD